MNIIENSQMIEFLEDFVNSEKPDIWVGGMAGSFIFKHVIESVLSKYSFNEILIIEGCQDYIGLMKSQLDNHYHYTSLFSDNLVDPLIAYDPFIPMIKNPKPEYTKGFNQTKCSYYEIIIVNDAHLIPKEYINMLIENYHGKICFIVDPFDILGDEYLIKGSQILSTTIPTIVDSLNKLSPIIAMARGCYGVDTRSIDKTNRGTISEIKVSKRSIGKVDDKQYISNDDYWINVVREKQQNSAFRKRQKLIVNSDCMYPVYDKQTQRLHMLSRNSMVVIDSVTKPYMSLRLYSSKIIVTGDCSYDTEDNTPFIKIKPGNILSLNESVYHRYNHAVLLYGEPLSVREKYSILKNSNNVSVCSL